MTFLGAACFLGPIYAVVIGLLWFFPDFRKDNPWIPVMILGILGETMFATYHLIVQLPWIILALGGAAIPLAVAIRIVAPVFWPGGLPGHRPKIEVIEPPRRRGLARLLPGNKQRRLER